jgi:hypothetical protein
MSWRIELALLAIASEVAAVLLPIWQGIDSITLGYSLALHLLALAAVLPAALVLAGKNTGKFSPGMLLLLSGLVLVLPLVGVLAIFCILLGQHALARQDRARRFRSLPLPSYQATRERDQYSQRVDALHDQLLSDSTPVPARLRALLAIQHMQPRYAAAALRRMLGDETDDVRLLAYGVLDASEKSIAGRIEQASACFRKTSPESPQAHAAVARELAELHWELVYQDLVQGNVREFCMKQVVHFATLALRQNMKDAGLWLMMGRVRMLAGDRVGAAQDFTSATAQGIPHARVALYLAELAFLNRDYAAVRRLMQHGKGHYPLQLSQQLCSYWTPGGGGMPS